MARRYRAFAIGPDGSLDEGRVWAELGDRAPDGCTLDAEGAIWFANANHREVVRVREGGEVTDVLENSGQGIRVRTRRTRRPHVVRHDCRGDADPRRPARHRRHLDASGRRPSRRAAVTPTVSIL